MRVCSLPGCGQLTPTTGRCAQHRDQRGSAASRGYDHRWRKTRAAYLAEHPLCQGVGCFAWATDVHHLDGLGPNGPDGHSPANLQGLCHSCHSRTTAVEQPGGWHTQP